jgi:Tfp pilus assembly protein PilZ
MTRPRYRPQGAARASKASTGDGRAGAEQRRSSGLLRIPFVRRCTLTFEGGQTASAFLVNINVLGAYVAFEEQPMLGEAVECRFMIPGNEIEIVAGGVVAWLNPKQSHPVHSLPPGFGVRFEGLSERDLGRIGDMVRSYVARSGLMRR